MKSIIDTAVDYGHQYKGTKVFISPFALGSPKIQISPGVPMTDAKREEINVWFLQMFGREDDDVYIAHMSNGERAIVTNQARWEEMDSRQKFDALLQETMRGIAGPWAAGAGGLMPW